MKTYIQSGNVVFQSPAKPKVFYLHAPNGIARSKLVEKMGKAFTGVSMTARNLNTVNKLAEMIA